MPKRINYTSPLRVKDLRSGEVYNARMLNYSRGGIFFESDGVFQKGAKIYICIKNSPYIRTSDVLEYYYGEVRWRKDLKRSLFNFGYGIQLVSDSRRHPRKPFSRTVQFSNHKGIFKGRTKNISASGVFIATEEKIKVGQVIKLDLPMKSKTAKIIGQVAWLNEEGFGLKFKKID
jgi:Tfp pilus assembly protein PilZ